MSKDVLIKLRFNINNIKNVLGLDENDAISNNLRREIKFVITDFLDEALHDYDENANEILAGVKKLIEENELSVRRKRQPSDNPKCICHGCKTKVRQQKYHGYCYQCYIIKGCDLCAADVQQFLHTNKTKMVSRI